MDNLDLYSMWKDSCKYVDVSFLLCFIYFIKQGSHSDWKNLGKWEGIFQSGKSQGKITQNTGKFREFHTNIICYFLVIFE